MKIGRNEPCPCGSGKKYKKCHLAEDEARTRAASEPHQRTARDVARRMADHFLVSEGVDDETLAIAERYFEEKDAGRGPAQQLMDFAQPLIDASDGTPDGLNKALSMAMVFWNAALEPEGERDEALANTLLKDADEEVRSTFQAMADLMIARHEVMFPELHRR